MPNKTLNKTPTCQTNRKQAAESASKTHVTIGGWRLRAGAWAGLARYRCDGVPRTTCPPHATPLRHGQCMDAPKTMAKSVPGTDPYRSHASQGLCQQVPLGLLGLQRIIGSGSIAHVCAAAPGMVARPRGGHVGVTTSHQTIQAGAVHGAAGAPQSASGLAATWWSCRECALHARARMCVLACIHMSNRMHVCVHNARMHAWQCRRSKNAPPATTQSMHYAWLPSRACGRAIPEPCFVCCVAHLDHRVSV